MPDEAPLDCSVDNPVTYRRAFNRPTGLAPEDRVWLSIEHFSANSIQVLLNGTPVYQTDTGNSLRLDLTPFLEPTNQLSVQLNASAASLAALDGPVSLQIESRVQ